MKRLFLTFLVCEAAYVASIRALIYFYTGSVVNREVYWCGLRLLSAAMLVWIFRQLSSGKSALSTRSVARCLPATGIFLAPILVGRIGLEEDDRYLFALTSILVGLREELAYRGILQNLLTRQIGIAPSLLISNLIFVAYHFGIQPFTAHYVLQIFLCGIILGFVYHVSGSIILVVALHSIYDAIDSFSPFLAPPLPDFVCTLVLVSTLLALLIANQPPKIPEPASVTAP